MNLSRATLHRWVRKPEAMDWIRAGWLALPSLEGTTHGTWSVHMVALCECEEVVGFYPKKEAA